ncbi:MAG: hypothetical protein HY000_02685 [Planctomycetes bacterium]|nr:hypothetical protein [Planctomycetota bacterium]
MVRHSRGEVIRLIELAQEQGYSSAVPEVLGIDSTAALEADWKVWLASRPTSPETYATAVGKPANGSLSGKHSLATPSHLLFP